MHGTISVEQAIERGHKMISYPSLTIIFGMMFLGPFASWIIGCNPVIIVVSGLFGFPMQILYALYITTKWRIWAFSRVADVHELKVAAINAQFIARDGSRLSKLEIRTKADMKALEKIQARFDERSKFVDDPTVPAETEIYFRRDEMVNIILFGSSIAIIISIIIFANSGTDPFGIVILTFGSAGLVVSKMMWAKRKKRITALILSNEGIHAPDGFNKWQDISEEELHRSKSPGGSRSTVYNQLRYKVFDKPAPNVDLDEMDMPSIRFIHLLYIYRRCFEAAKGI